MTRKISCHYLDPDGRYVDASQLYQEATDLLASASVLAQQGNPVAKGVATGEVIAAAVVVTAAILVDVVDLPRRLFPSPVESLPPPVFTDPGSPEETTGSPVTSTARQEPPPRRKDNDDNKKDPNRGHPYRERPGPFEPRQRTFPDPIPYKPGSNPDEPDLPGEPYRYRPGRGSGENLTSKGKITSAEPKGKTTSAKPKWTDEQEAQWMKEQNDEAGK